METVTTKSAGATDRARATGAFSPKHEVKQATPVELKEGEVVLASIRQSTTPSKIIIEFVAAIKNESAGVNVLALLNQSDERFNASSVSIRRNWLSSEKADAIKNLGIDPKFIKEAETNNDNPVVIMLKTPTVLDQTGKKHELAIQLNDSLTPWDEFQKENPKENAKQREIKGEVRYFTVDGKLIYNQTRIVTKESLKHNIINASPNGIMSWEDVEALQAKNNPANYAEAING